MGSEIGVRIRKGLIFTIRCFCRSVSNHPFLVGFLCFLILLYRSSPFLFSLLVSASPVLVCTGALLGVLLSYGEPNLPEIDIEIEEKKSNGSCFVERFGEDRADDTAPLIEERSREIEPDGAGIWEGGGGENRELISDLKLKTEWIDEKLKDEAIESDGDKSDADSFDSEKVNVDSLDSPPCSPWTRIEEGDENEEDSGSDSGSDRAESSSPDASMADIMPMLDELHPLLDTDMIPPQSIRGPGSGSERSSESSTESYESGDESEENHGGLEEDENEDGEDDDAKGEKEEPLKSAIRWTEEDQKNLMDLGSSEIERNQRLENLIMRRRARKYMGMAPERNLIDLDSIDYPFGLAPISTRRQNPFDDSYSDNLDLPPIPGSAPSVMLQRRNPFDIPYDSSEEKPDLMGDGFKEEFATSQSRGAVFRRHESFNVGPSVFAPGGKGARMRPYFVPEGMVLEESSYSSSFLRQSSELSESKVSSVPETESIGSVQDLDDNQQEIEPSPRPNEVVEEPQLIYHHEEEQEEEVEEEDVNGAPELISEIENVPELVGHGSESSEDEESVGSGRDELDIQMEDATETYHPDYEGVEGVYRRGSSSSSVSEVSERAFTEIESEGLSLSEERTDVGILTRTSDESPDWSVSSALAIDIPHRAPVYDSSPRPNENIILPVTSITHLVYVDPREHGNVSIDFSEVEKETPEESISLKFSVETSVVEEHGSGEISGARDDEKSHNLDKSSEEQFEVSEPLFDGRAIQLEEERETVGSPDSDDDTYQRTDEKKFISTTSVEGNAYPIHDTDEIREPNFQHLDEVLASSSLIELEWSEDDRIIHDDSNTSEVQVLDHDSPLGPESLSNPPGATETTKTHFEGQSETVEQVDDSQEIDVDILAELDNVGDFSVQQWGPGSAGFGKHTDSVEENEIVEDVVHSEKSREDIDIHEEIVESILESQITEFDERNSPDSPNSKTSENFEAEADEKIESFPGEDKSIASGGSEINYTETAYEMHELEAGKIEDIDVAFKEIAAKEMIVDFEPVDREEHGNSTVVEPTHVVSVLEVGPIEKDETLDSKQSLSDSVDHELHVIEPEETQEAFSERASREHETLPGEKTGIEVQPDEKTESFSDKAELVQNEVLYQSQADVEVTFVMTDLEASKIEDIDLAFKEITDKETRVEEAIAEDSKNESSSVVDPTIELSVMEVVPIEKEAIVKETLAEGSNNESLSVVGSTLDSSVPEVVQIEKEASLDSKQSVSESVDRALNVIVSEETEGDSSGFAVAEASVPSEETTLPPLDKVLELLKPNSDDEWVEVKTDEVGPSVVESRVQGISVPAEKPDNEVETPNDSHSIPSVVESRVQGISVPAHKPDSEVETPDSHSIPSGKGKDSKSSSSSSSSSSDSSSSDSDKE